MKRTSINDLDASFKWRVARQPGGEGITRCFSCKACTAACPICLIEPRYDPRKIIRMVLLGMEQEVLKNDLIWLCSTCYGCREVCPQDVRFTDVMFAIKNIAAQEGCVPAGLMGQKTILKKHGRLYEVGDFENEKREKMGLPAIREMADDYDKLL
jgi:heterodisulfide reductase subunit C|uniref:4Fe-4S dicluster domain-containing protein n=1 Tax=Desulfomonile tiedjei TaxID=2358 RepID=A0A7C4AR96_9BACT